MFFVIFPALSLLATAIDLSRPSRRRQGWRVAAWVLLRYLLVFSVGLQGWAAFYGHAFRSDLVAASIGWGPSPFEFEVAIANLAFGTVGILCFWMEGSFWTAVVIAASIWLWGDAIGHIKELIVAHNHAPNNAGPALYSDLILPAALIILFIVARPASSELSAANTARSF